MPYERVVKDLKAHGDNWNGPVKTLDGSLATAEEVIGGGRALRWTAKSPMKILGVAFTHRVQWDGDPISSTDVLVNGVLVGTIRDWGNKQALVLTFPNVLQIEDIEVRIGVAMNTPGVSEMIPQYPGK